MPTITILSEDSTASPKRFRATIGDRHAHGATVGEALDGSSPEFGTESALVVIQSMTPDRFFTAAQQQRVAELMARWRAARDAGTTLYAAEQTELETLVGAELRASGERAAALARRMPT